MIFIGDIAVPGPAYSQQLDKVFVEHQDIFRGKEILCNLEGLIADMDTRQRTPVLFNHPAIVPVLKQWNFKVAALANNHTLDIPEHYGATMQLLNTAGIAAPGAGYSVVDADRPVSVVLDGKQTFVFNYCWAVMLQHQNNPSAGVYVNTIRWKPILDAVSRHKKEHPDALIVVLMHWSFDLETLPFPIYRQFSRTLIDAGVNVIAGCHSHCVQGAEAYKNGYIVYGMGNFFVPWHTYIGGTIHFPDFSRTEMAFEWNPNTNKAVCHWFKYQNTATEHKLDHVLSEDFSAGEMTRFYTPYAGMDASQYLHFFKANRRKRGGIPMYRDYRENIRNRLADWLIIRRIRLARMLAKYKMRQWNN